MKKKITTIAASVLILALVATATGCGGEKAVKVPEDSETSSSAEAPSNDDEDTSAAKPKGKSDASITEYTLAKWFSYSEDVAWVMGYDEMWHLIDKNGNILFDLEAGSTALSYIFDGITVVENDSEFLGLTTENKIVSSLSKADYASIKYVDSNIFFVTKETKAFEGDSTEYGLFDIGKDDWLTPLGELPIDEDGRDCEHLGNNVYQFDRNTLFSADTQNSKYDENGFRELQNVKFVDGSAIYVKRDWNTDDCSIEKINSKDFSTTEILKFGEYYGNLTCLALSENLFFLSPRSVTVGYGIETEAAAEPLGSDAPVIKTGLYDMSGNLAVDLNEYNFKGIAVVDGNLLATLSNPNGTAFTTVFDKTGKMLFDPIEGKYEYASEGAFYLNDGFYDINGNLIVKIEGDFDIDGFQNDVLWTWTTTDSGMKQLKLIDKKGETLFETGYVGQ